MNGKDPGGISKVTIDPPRVDSKVMDWLYWAKRLGAGWLEVQYRLEYKVAEEGWQEDRS